MLRYLWNKFRVEVFITLPDSFLLVPYCLKQKCYYENLLLLIATAVFSLILKKILTDLVIERNRRRF